MLRHDRALGVLAPLACSRFLLIPSHLPTGTKIGQYSDACVDDHGGDSLFVLKHFLICFEAVPVCFKSVSLFVLKRVLVCFEAFPRLF